jgi:predicted DNA-binding transcriptional regulator AlpA
MIDRLVSPKEVAAKFGICVRGVWRGVQKGDLPRPVKVGRCTRFVLSEIEGAMNALKAARGTQ